MKKLLLIALAAMGLLLVPVQRSDAQITVGVGGVGVGYGYPAYGYGYYPYGYYRPYPYYGYYSGRHTTGPTDTAITAITGIITTIGTKLT